MDEFLATLVERLSARSSAQSETSSDSSFDKQIRPLQDAINGLRCLDMKNIGIEIPSIVVIGNQSSGKSSVLESLAGINLPKGTKMCTRMPLILQMKDNSSPTLEVELVFEGSTTKTTEEKVADEITKITEKSIGDNGISTKVINLIVSRKDMPNLTLIDLPGIIQCATEGQPNDLPQKIRDLITDYIKQKDNIILNVLSADVDFPTCESIRMSREADKEGHRTLAVVTKADKHTGDLEQKVMDDDVRIRLGYVCVRNRLPGESHEAARKAEKMLFKTPPLSRLDPSKVGVGILMLRQKLLDIQEKQIRQCLPRISKEIQDKLDDYKAKETQLPPTLLPTDKENLRTVLEHHTDKLIKSLEMLLVRAEFQDYPDKDELHCTARIRDKLCKFYTNLEGKYLPEDKKFFSFAEADDGTKPAPQPQVLVGEALKDEKKQLKETQDQKFFSFAEADDGTKPAPQPQVLVGEALKDEKKQLKETLGPWLPVYLSRNAFITQLHKRVDEVAKMPGEFMTGVWKDVEDAILKVIRDTFDPYRQMIPVLEKAAKNVLEEIKKSSIDRMSEMVEMEKNTDYTCNREFESLYKSLRTGEGRFLRSLPSTSHANNDDVGGTEMNTVDEAFKLRVKLVAYWKIVVMRMVDVSAMHLKLSIKKLLDGKLKSGLRDEVLGLDKQALEKITVESPEKAERRKELKDRINKLKTARGIVASVSDNPNTAAD